MHLNDYKFSLSFWYTLIEKAIVAEKAICKYDPELINNHRSVPYYRHYTLREDPTLSWPVKRRKGGRRLRFL